MTKTTLRPLAGLSAAIAALLLAAPASAASDAKLYETFRAQDRGEAVVAQPADAAAVTFDMNERLGAAEHDASQQPLFLRFREENR